MLLTLVLVTFVGCQTKDRAISQNNAGVEYYKVAQRQAMQGATAQKIVLLRQSIKKFTEAIQSDPALEMAYMNRANAYRIFGQYEEALEDYNKVIGLNPDNAEAHFNKGMTHHELEEYQEALKEYDSAIGLNPDNAEVHLHRGITHFELGQHLG